MGKTLDKNQAAELFKLMTKYQPETQAAKKDRIEATAAAVAANENVSTSAPICLKYGLKHVTTLIEQKKAKLVVIAHDVDPIELVVWLPALCRKMNVPYVIVKSKARLGKIVHKKNAAVLALTNFERADKAEIDRIIENARAQFNDNPNTS